MRVIEDYFERTGNNPERVDRYDFISGGAFLYMDRNGDRQTLPVISKVIGLTIANLGAIYFIRKRDRSFCQIDSFNPLLKNPQSLKHCFI